MDRQPHRLPPPGRTAGGVASVPGTDGAATDHQQQRLLAQLQIWGSGGAQHQTPVANPAQRPPGARAVSPSFIRAIDEGKGSGDIASNPGVASASPDPAAPPTALAAAAAAPGPVTAPPSIGDAASAAPNPRLTDQLPSPGQIPLTLSGLSTKSAVALLRNASSRGGLVPDPTSMAVTKLPPNLAGGPAAISSSSLGVAEGDTIGIDATIGRGEGLHLTSSTTITSAVVPNVSLPLREEKTDEEILREAGFNAGGMLGSGRGGGGGPDSFLSSRHPRRKKPKDMPKRPLSAYNLFFKDVRLEILEEKKRRKQQLGDSLGQHARHRHNSEIEEENPPDEGTQKRNTGFESMAKTVASRWKVLGSAEREKYDNLAEEEWDRYRAQMEEYNRNTKERRREKEEAENLKRAKDRARRSEADESLRRDILRARERSAVAATREERQNDGQGQTLERSSLTIGMEPSIDKDSGKARPPSSANPMLGITVTASSSSRNDVNPQAKRPRFSMGGLNQVAEAGGTAGIVNPPATSDFLPNAGANSATTADAVASVAASSSAPMPFLTPQQAQAVTLVANNPQLAMQLLSQHDLNLGTPAGAIAAAATTARSTQGPGPNANAATIDQSQLALLLSSLGGHAGVAGLLPTDTNASATTAASTAAIIARQHQQHQLQQQQQSATAASALGTILASLPNGASAARNAAMASLPSVAAAPVVPGLSGTEQQQLAALQSLQAAAPAPAVSSGGDRNVATQLLLHAVLLRQQQQQQQGRGSWPHG
uniref:HMG box domain-containing protein n=1 Tax=Odontella aurita TaxID=265563 RepID=A0A7S4K8U3_9STRA|mmetsp:Transcript_7016/g.20998  ORF Transcript_7016/g.20998 Transcript_7016/m.20998 type:complete len:769 (+) Transcript_7016:161-2467(+)